MGDKEANINIHIGDVVNIHLGSGITLDQASDQVSDQGSNQDEYHAFEKIHEAQARRTVRDVTLLCGEVDCPNEKLPIVHPSLLDVKFYEGGADHKLRAYRPSNDNDADCFYYHKTIQFEELLGAAKRNHFCALIGPPGCGKTTCSKRLAKQNDLMCLHYNFMEMGYGEQKLSLQQLLIDFVHPDLDANTHKKAFKWISSHANQCAFIFDGYDQATWSLDGVAAVNASYETPLLVQQLIANLCGGKFLPDATVIFTSRPHAMISVPEPLRPKLTILVHDLSDEDMKLLFHAMAGEHADKLWHDFATTAPLLLNLCRTPALLQFIIFAALSLGSQDVERLHTLTGTYSTLLEHIGHSSVSRGQAVEQMREQIGKLAYGATQRASVMMNVDDLEREGLDETNVQDYIIALPGYKGCNQRLLPGDKRYFFVHQTWQEYFTAYHICYFLADDEFDVILQKLVTDNVWSMVRRFVCGILMNKSSPNSERTATFSQEMIKHFQQAAEGDFLELLIDLQEVEDEFLQPFVDSFPVVVVFSYITFGSSNAFALARILRKVNKGVEKLEFVECVLNIGLMEICKAVGEMKNKMTHLNLRGSTLGSDAMSAIAQCVHNVEEMDLRICDITTIAPLTEAVAKLENPMRQLNFSGNGIGNVGANLLADCVQNIKELEIREGEITNIENLAGSVLRHNHQLKLLDLSFNPFGDEGLPALISCLGNIEKVRMHRCPISENGKAQIRSKLMELNLPQRRVIW